MTKILKFIFGFSILQNSVKATFDYDVMFHMVKHGDIQSVQSRDHNVVGYLQSFLTPWATTGFTFALNNTYQTINYETYLTTVNLTVS